MTTLLTMATAIGAILCMMSIWIAIDRMTNRRLGARVRCCRALSQDTPCAGCAVAHEPESCEYAASCSPGEATAPPGPAGQSPEP